MKKCCENHADSRFCPECGSPTQGADSLSALVWQCRKNATGLRSQAKRCSKNAEESIIPRDKDWHQKDQEKYLASAKKWDSWADQVIALSRKAGET